MLRQLKNHFNATRFEFQLHVHSLQPWPATSKGIAVGWQRGKRRRGATATVTPAPGPELGGATVVRFNERIGFKSTLYKVRPRACMRGPARDTQQLVSWLCGHPICMRCHDARADKRPRMLR
jgi:hypothetical protein